MDDLDPATAVSLDDLAICLRQLHLQADKPTYRALEQQTTHEGRFLPGTRLRRVRLTRTTVSDMLLGQKFPGKAFMLTFVDACGIDLENDRRWEQAWDRLAVRVPSPETPVGELRQQLAAAEHRAQAAEDRVEKLAAMLREREAALLQAIGRPGRQ